MSSKLMDILKTSNEKAIEKPIDSYTEPEELAKLLMEYSEISTQLEKLCNNEEFSFNKYCDMTVAMEKMQYDGGSLRELFMSGKTPESILKTHIKILAEILNIQNDITEESVMIMLAVWNTATLLYYKMVGNIKITKDFGGRTILANDSDLKDFKDKFSYKFYCPTIPFCEVEIGLMKVRKTLIDNGDYRLDTRDFVLSIYNYCKLREINNG